MGFALLSAASAAACAGIGAVLAGGLAAGFEKFDGTAGEDQGGGDQDDGAENGGKHGGVAPFSRAPQRRTGDVGGRIGLLLKGDSVPAQGL